LSILRNITSILPSSATIGSFVSSKTKLRMKYVL
jgi:hypothetical protein